MIKKVGCKITGILNWFRHFDFLSLLALRLYLVPVFWMAGTRKIQNMDNVIAWFRDGLQLPMPTLMAYLTTYTEVIGAICLLLGLAVRIITIPLMIVMIVAATTVHWVHGWNAIAPAGAESSIRLSNFLDWLQSNYPQRYEYITELGQPVMLNNGIEFAVTFFIMLTVLFFYGGGRYLSVDYWVCRRCSKS
jgi:uncharacterized membrane protein YphA (DoxX/SURF4 family)